MIFDKIKRLLKKFYEDNDTKLTYHLGEREAVRIIGDYVLRERKIINTDEFDIVNINLIGYDKLEITVSPKKKTTPPPPKDPIVPKESENDVPMRASL